VIRLDTNANSLTVGQRTPPAPIEIAPMIRVRGIQ
jgi:hypothetical protein